MRPHRQQADTWAEDATAISYIFEVQEDAMSISPTFKKIIARGLLLVSGASVLSGCFFEPPGAYEPHGCYQCGGEGHYHHGRRDDHRDDRGDD